MQELKLGLKKREIFGKKAAKLTKDGVVLGNVFGKGEESIPVQGDYKIVNKMIQHAGKSSPIEIEIEGDGNHLVLVSDIERNNVSQKLHHVTFQIIKKGQKVHTTVPIKFEGEAPATRNGLILITLRDDVEIEAIPSKLPHELIADLSNLVEPDDSITVADLNPGEGVEILTEPETALAKIDVPRAEVEEVEEETEEEAGEVPSEHGGEEEGASQEKDKEAKSE